MGTAQPVVIDPALPSQLAAGPVPALLWWDDQVADRFEVAEFLRENGIKAQIFGRLSGAVVCAATPDIVQTMTGAPGAVSVWGDHPLQPALDGSVEAAFNGDPSAVWEDDGVTGEGVTIAVVDTGVDATHPDLQYGIRTRLNVRVTLSHWDILGPNGDPCVPDQYSDQMEDSELTSGHGTHIASVAAGDGTMSGGLYTGMAPGADIIGVGVADTVTPQEKLNDGAVELSLLGAIAGINYVLLNGVEADAPAKVILAGWTQDGLYDPWHPMGWALRGAFEDGVNVVFPAGNAGPDVSDCSTEETCSFNAWAADPHAIGVAATPKHPRDAVEPYSSRGDPEPRQARNLTVRYEPTLAAPGTGVVAARRPGLTPYVTAPGSILGAGSDGNPVVLDPRYVGLTGTSVAAAHVAGAIALMQQAAVDEKGCYLTPAQVIEILTTTATPMAGAESWEAGAGALDATAAVDAARAVPAVASSSPWMCPAGGG